MPPVAFHIVKATDWRGKAEEFENVYHYDVPNVSTQAGYNDLVDAIVSLEKSFHGSEVAFKRAAVHGPTNEGKMADQMIFAKDLSGVGAISGGQPIAKEHAVVAQIYMGRSPAPHFRKTFLRKYWHVCRLYVADAAGQLGNSAMNTTNTDFYITKMNAFKNITIGNATNGLVKPSGGGIPSGTNATVLAHLRTRQFRR